MEFSARLINWYLQHKRDLPWRDTRDPYRIWLSEIILQQTRVAQGLPYYRSFIAAFPTVHDLANASEQQVLKLWQGLGYYSRARHLHQAAIFISNELQGEFPKTYQELLKIKGVGTYTAAAIASFCYHEAVPVVDGNVYRVLSRYLGVATDIALASAKKEFTALAYELMPKDQPDLFNQALMEFGALQCVPKNPACTSCVLQNSCVALATHQVENLPNKSKKINIKQRHFNYIVLQDAQNKSLIQQRSQKDIWQNLFEFPCIETTKELAMDEFIDVLCHAEFLKHPIIRVAELNPLAIKHQLSHQQLYIKFWGVKIEGQLTNGFDYETICSHPFPIVLYNFIANNWQEL